MNRREVWRFVRRWVLGSDVGIVYSILLAIVLVVLQVVPDPVHDHVVAFTSTNLRGLRVHPLTVLVTSAFVLPSWSGLWLQIPMILVVFSVVQPLLGRATLIITAAFGHIGATLFVSVLLRSGISKGLVDPAVRLASDVGVSYALVGVAGIAVAWFTTVHMKLLYVTLVSMYLLGYVVFSRTFTDVGHLSAWFIGLCVACVIGAARRRPLPD